MRSASLEEVKNEDRLLYPFRNWGQYLLTMVAAALLFNAIFWPNAFGTIKGTILATLWSSAHWVTQSLGNGWVVSQIDKRISWLEQPWKRTIFGFFGLILFSTLAFLFVQSLFIFLWYGKLPDDLMVFYSTSIRIAVTISFSIAFILTTVAFLKNWRSSSVEAERLRAEVMTYKYESLRNQVNPHFLFNSLNVLTDLVQEDQEQAVKFIRQLSELYRYVLDSREREVVPLAEELDFIRSFIFLLETRFEGQLKVKLEVDEQDNESIVPMALQVLVENAVKHNVLSTKEPLVVEIRKEDDAVVVSHEYRPKPVGMDSSGTGLSNLESRYAYLSDQPLTIGPENGRYVARIPILTMQS